MEFPGRTLQAGESVLSDWFPRSGDNAVFRAQLVAAQLDGSSNPTGTVNIKVLTKNSEEPGDGAEITAAAMSFTTTDDVGDIKEELVISTAGSTASTGIMEMMRYKVEVTTGWMRVNVFYPVSFDSAI